MAKRAAASKQATLVATPSKQKKRRDSQTDMHSAALSGEGAATFVEVATRCTAPGEMSSAVCMCVGVRACPFPASSASASLWQEDKQPAAHPTFLFAPHALASRRSPHFQAASETGDSDPGSSADTAMPSMTKARCHHFFLSGCPLAANRFKPRASQPGALALSPLTSGLAANH